MLKSKNQVLDVALNGNNILYRTMRIVNYYDHEGDNRYVVYEYHKVEHADYFQELLESKNVVFERHMDEEKDRILFGVSKRFRKDSSYCNNMTHARFRKPFIKNSILKYALLVLTFGAITLGIIGYFKSR